MANNPEGYDVLLTAPAEAGKMDAEVLVNVPQPTIDSCILPEIAAEETQEPPSIEPVLPAQEIDTFFQQRAERQTETSPTDVEAEEMKAALPEWAVAALLAGCAEMGERRRREDAERRARERREREEG